ncbi:MAG: hypothetical protein ACQETH_05200 [Candidatus Rifleibacteriota bacterium]
MKNIILVMLMMTLTINIVSASSMTVQKIAEFDAGFKSMAYYSGHIYILTKENCIIKVSSLDGTMEKIHFANPTNSSFTDLSVFNEKVYLCQYSGSHIYILDLNQPGKGLAQISCKSENIGRINGISANSSALIIKDDINNLYMLNSKGQTKKISDDAQFINDGSPLISTCKVSSGKWKITLGNKNYAYNDKSKGPIVQLSPIGKTPTEEIIFLEVTGEGTFNSKFFLTKLQNGEFERLLQIQPPALFGINITNIGDSGEIYIARRNLSDNRIQIERINK